MIQLVWAISFLAAMGGPPPPVTAPLPPPGPVRPPPVVMTPFRLGLTYVNVLSEDGPTANEVPTQAVGVDLAFSSTTYVRNHLGLAHQWESEGAYSARGFRIDLVSLGYPIELWRTERFRLDLEPMLNVIRAEILFVTDADALLRLSAGAGLELSATYRRWFFALQPQIDFRYLVYNEGESDTSFTRRFPLRLTLGHEF